MQTHSHSLFIIKIYEIGGVPVTRHQAMQHTPVQPGGVAITRHYLPGNATHTSAAWWCAHHQTPGNGTHTSAHWWCAHHQTPGTATCISTPGDMPSPDTRQCNTHKCSLVVYLLGVASKQLRLLHGRVGDSTIVVNSLSPQMSELVEDAIAS